MANKHRLLVLLFQLSPILLLATVRCSDDSEIPEARDDDDIEDKRPSVKKWFNSLISANPQSNKKSPTSTSSPPTSSSHNSSVSYSPPASVNKQYPVPIVPMPVPMAAPLYHYPMAYPPVPFMAYPYSHSSLASSRTPLMTVPMLPNDMISSSAMYPKDRFPFYSNNYLQPSMYFANPTHPGYNYDSRGFAYAIPVPVMPYAKRHNGPVKYKPSLYSKPRPIKYADKSHLDPTSDEEESQSRGVESRQTETLSPTFEPNDVNEPFEEEYTNEPSQEGYENDEGGHS